MKIAFSGTHGTGKTTAAFELALQYKKNSNSDVYLIQEVARRCPFPINTQANAESHTWILTEQIKQELEAVKKHNVVICDRTVLDTLAYTKYLGMIDLFESLLPIVMKHLKSYDKIILRRTSEFDYAIDDGVRDVSNTDFRIGVENNLIELYRMASSNGRVQVLENFE